MVAIPFSKLQTAKAFEAGWLRLLRRRKAVLRMGGGNGSEPTWSSQNKATDLRVVFLLFILLYFFFFFFGKNKTEIHGQLVLWKWCFGFGFKALALEVNGKPPLLMWWEYLQVGELFCSMNSAPENGRKDISMWGLCFLTLFFPGKKDHLPFWGTHKK